MSHPLTQETIEYDYAEHPSKNILSTFLHGSVWKLSFSGLALLDGRGGVGRANPRHTALSAAVSSASDGSGTATLPGQGRPGRPLGLAVRSDDSHEMDTYIDE
jgi:hypothetical protein